MDTRNPDPESDAALNAALKAWAVPPLSAAVKFRVTQALAQQTARPANSPPLLWPWSPLRLAGASLAAAALGCVLSFTVPMADGAADDIASFAAAYTFDPAAAASEDSDDLIAELW